MRMRLLTYNIHKGIGGVDPEYRLERVIEATDHCEPDVVLLRPFGPLPAACRGPHAHLAAVQLPPRPGFERVMPLRSLDRIYYRGNLQLDHSFASRTAVARLASDHVPLVADFFVPMDPRP